MHRFHGDPNKGKTEQNICDWCLTGTYTKRMKDEKRKIAKSQHLSWDIKLWMTDESPWETAIHLKNLMEFYSEGMNGLNMSNADE